MKFNLITDELVHLSLSLAVGGFFYYRHRDWRLILAALVTGFLVDLDHWLDYFFYYGPMVNLKLFFGPPSYMALSRKIYVLFHGWEYLVPLALIGHWLEKRWKIKNLAVVLVLAYFFHLLWDQLCYGQHPLAYFFTYRFLNYFSIEGFHGF